MGINRTRSPLNRHEDRNVFAIMAVLGLAASIAAIAATARVNPLRGDSAEYLYFDPSRTVGYPAYLALVRLVTRQVALAIPIQILVLGASLLFLGWSFHRLVHSRLVSFGFLATLLLQPGMWFASAFLMTEALSTALVACWCAQLLRLIKTPRPDGMALLIGISLAATMVRPSLVALVFGTLAFIFSSLDKRSRIRCACLAIFGVVCAWEATPLAQLLVHGSPRTTSPFARGVLQHSLYCAASISGKDADFDFVEGVAAPVRHYINNAPSQMQEQFRRSYSTPLRFGLIIPALGRRHGALVRSDVDRYLAPIAATRVEANPLCYLRSAANEYLRLTAFDTDPTKEDAAQVNLYMKSNPPPRLVQYPVLPGDRQMALRAASEVHAKPSGLTPPQWRMNVQGDVPRVALLPMRIIFAFASLIGVLSIALLAVRQRLSANVRQMLPAGAAIGIAFHGALAMTAIVEIGFFRYLMPLWPIVCSLCFLAVLETVEFCSRRRFRAVVVSAAKTGVET